VVVTALSCSPAPDAITRVPLALLTQREGFRFTKRH
jgi:hypothetical protein